MQSSDKSNIIATDGNFVAYIFGYAERMRVGFRFFASNTHTHSTNFWYVFVVECRELLRLPPCKNNFVYRFPPQKI